MFDRLWCGKLCSEVCNFFYEECVILWRSAAFTIRKKISFCVQLRKKSDDIKLLNNDSIVIFV